jgi:hypothetical protein
MRLWGRRSWDACGLGIGKGVCVDTVVTKQGHRCVYSVPGPERLGQGAVCVVLFEARRSVDYV